MVLMALLSASVKFMTACLFVLEKGRGVFVEVVVREERVKKKE